MPGLLVAQAPNRQKVDTEKPQVELEKQYILQKAASILGVKVTDLSIEKFGNHDTLTLRIGGPKGSRQGLVDITLEEIKQGNFN